MEDGDNGANTERVVNLVAQERRSGQGSVRIPRHLMEGVAAPGQIAMKQHATWIVVQEIVSVKSGHIFKYKSAAQPEINVVRVKVTATKILNVLEILYVERIIAMLRNSRILTERIVVEKAMVCVNLDLILKYKSAAQPAINVVRVKVTATKILNVWEILYVDGAIVMPRNSRIMTKRIVVEKALVLATVKKKKKKK